ncbi:MAG: DUF484 family protein [Pseudomonadota bacterium]
MGKRQSLVHDDINDEALVIDYLLSNPDFFENHPDLLTRLSIPHDVGGAVSLVERQLTVYREKCLRLEKQLKELLDVARNNERIGQLLHQFAVDLLGAQSTAAAVHATRESAQRDFGADEVSLQLFDNDATVDAMFADMSASRSVICGRLSAAQRAKLFDEADDIASVALILLHAEGENLGILALGSKERSHFHRSKGVVFLTQLGNLVSHRLLALK